MERYQTAFYEPLVADWSNFGTWTERGEKDATERAVGIWQGIVEAEDALAIDPAHRESLEAFIARRTAEGGAAPES